MTSQRAGRDAYTAQHPRGATANTASDETPDERFTFAALIRGDGKLLGEARYRARTDPRIRGLLAQVDARRAETERPGGAA